MQPLRSQTHVPILHGVMVCMIIIITFLTNMLGKVHDGVNCDYHVALELVATVKS